MNGIDVSNWQSGIDLSAVSADFVIVKVTEGVSYVSPAAYKQCQQTLNTGKCLGVYHYANGGNVQAEADYFLAKVKDYIGKAVLALDWESENNAAFGKTDYNWVKSWCDYVYKKTGVKPLVYVQQSALGKIKGIGDYGFWVAQYGDMNPTGYQETPWNEGSYSCVIRQYSPAGRLTGYNGYLDLNKAYINKAEWNKYAGVKTESAPEKSYKFVEATVLGKACKFTGFTENNENWIKATAALEAIGYTAKWNGTKKRVVAVKNGKETLLDIRTYISEDSISFCPLRELYEYLGYAVEWDSKSKKITVKKC
jgi:GH25 family lysozyme M1 (1,4-beta-N-acetylmuramidase)